MSSADPTCKSVACLRVLVQRLDGKPTSLELAVFVDKLISAFLETRWIWPRQFARVTPGAYVLSDPRVQLLDKVAVQALAQELQIKLFGVSGGGTVALLLFQGDEMHAYRFANLGADSLEKLASGEGGDISPPFEGELSQVTANGVQNLSLQSQASGCIPELTLRFSTPKFERNYEPVYRGVYSIPARCFFGNIALCMPLGADTLADSPVRSKVLETATTEEFDEGCVESAIAALGQTKVGGILFVPLNFSHLIRAAGRERYAEFLSRLPLEHRGKLVGSIYETPRDPSFFALSQALKFLIDQFGRINLTVSDPGFEIEKLSPGAVSSVTMMLPETGQRARIAAIHTFMKNRELFKSRQIRMGISRVVTRQELEACVALGVPAVSGPAVSGLLRSPAGTRGRDLIDLPIPSMPKPDTAAA